MKIAFDVDATLTDMNGFLRERGKAFFEKRGKAMIRPDATTAECMYGATDGEMRAFWKRYFFPYCLRVRLKPNIREALDSLRAQGHGLHVVTARLGSTRKDPLGWAMRYAVRWKFGKYGVRMDSYTFTNDALPDDKLNACRAGGFDTIVEDNPNHIEKIAGQMGIPVIVVSTPENARLEMPNLIRIRDLYGLEDAVKKAEALRRERE